MSANSTAACPAAVESMPYKPTDQPIEPGMPVEPVPVKPVLVEHVPVESVPGMPIEPMPGQPTGQWACQWACRAWIQRQQDWQQ